MALVPIKTSAGTGYCDCICGCYELVSLRDEETGKSFCPKCAQEHLEMNLGLGLPAPPPAKTANSDVPAERLLPMPTPADPPGRLR